MLGNLTTCVSIFHTFIAMFRNVFWRSTYMAATSREYIHRPMIEFALNDGN